MASTITNVFIKSEFFSVPNIDFIVKYINIIEIIEQNPENADVIYDICTLINLSKLTIADIATGKFATITAVIIVVNAFLFFLFIINIIIDIISTPIVGVIVDLIIDKILFPI